MVENKEVLTYPLTSYLAVLGVASLAGVVRYINSNGAFKWRFLLRDCLTSGFNGLVVFWLCDYKQINGSLQMVWVAVGAMMGSRAWVEVERYLKVRFGTSGAQSSDGQDQGDVLTDIQNENPSDTKSSGHDNNNSVEISGAQEVNK